MKFQRPEPVAPAGSRSPDPDEILALEPHLTFSADKPLVDPRDDRLGYAFFARHLALSLIRMVPADGFVVAIYGPWGSGKTTLLNFLFHYFHQAQPEEQPIIVPFNPWWFSGHQNLARHFFDQFRVSLAASQVVPTSLEEKIAVFADLVAELPTSLHIPYISIGKVAVEFTPMKPVIKNVVKLKTEIAAELRQQSRRIFVTVDDIDRLNPEEIRQLFGVIKSIADFPNIVYLLTFDKRVVIEALRESQGISGESYLEKIVQAPFELPLPDRSSLYRLMLSKLESIMTGTPEELFDQDYWISIFVKGLEHFLSTPRKINLLTNTLSVTYSAVRGEVNPVDFIAIEALRIFCPDAYNIIRSYPRKFTGRELVSGKIEQLRLFHKSWIAQVPEEDREAVQALLSRMFPKLENVWEDLGFDRPVEALWRKQLRICSPEIFPIYFHLALPQGTVANTEIMSILSLADDSDALAARLLDLIVARGPTAPNRLQALLDRLMDYTGKEIAEVSIPSIFAALFEVGDQLLLSEDALTGSLPGASDQRLFRIIRQLLRRQSPETRFEALESAITGGASVFLSAKTVTELSKLDGKYADEEQSRTNRLLSPDELAGLEKLVLAKIREAARGDSLFHCPRLPAILSFWKNLSGDPEPRDWVREVSQRDHQLLSLLIKFLEKDLSHEMINMEGICRYRLNYKALNAVLDPAAIFERARALWRRPDLDETQREALRQFLQNCDPKGGWLL